jgi:hypothetical protein
VTVVRNNDPWQVIEGTDEYTAGLDTYTFESEWVDDDPVTGLQWDGDAANGATGTDADVYYVRVRQAERDGCDPGVAWVGPLWVEVT